MSQELYRKYPGFKQTQIASDVDRHVEELEILGVSVMKDVIPREEAQDIERRLLELWQKQEKEFGKERLLELGEYGTHRGLLMEGDVFRQMVLQPRVLEVIYAILGDTAILNLQNASAAFPKLKHFQSTFHRDFAKDFVATKPISLNAFWCITDFTVENGATEVIMNTHRLSHFPSPAFLGQNIKPIVAPAGSVILWDSLLLHRTGYNSTDRPRFGINHMYTRPFVKQQIDFPVFLKGTIDVESKLGQILGFWTVPPKSVKEFRVDPDKRTYRSGQG